MVHKMRLENKMRNAYRRSTNGTNWTVLHLRIAQMALLMITLFLILPSFFSRFSGSTPKIEYLLTCHRFC